MVKPNEIERLLFELMLDRTDSVTELALAARSMVIKMASGSSELLYCSYAVSDVFSFTHKLGQAFIHTATYGNHVNLGFNRGALLKDEEQVLQGSGKLIRHVRLADKSTLRSHPVKRLVRQAIQQGRELAESKGGVQSATFINHCG